MHFADLGKINVARTVHAQISAVVDLPPNANAQLVLGPDDVFGGDWSQVNGSKCGGNIAKEIGSIQGKQLPGGGGYELLELSRRVGRQRRDS